jgi:hypothetical protein
MISSVGGGSPHNSANDSDIKAKFRWPHAGQTAGTTRHSSPKTVLKKLSALAGGDSPSATDVTLRAHSIAIPGVSRLVEGDRDRLVPGTAPPRAQSQACGRADVGLAGLRDAFTLENSPSDAGKDVKTPRLKAKKVIPGVSERFGIRLAPFGCH